MTGTPESDRTRYGARSRRSARQQAVIQQLSTRPVSPSLASGSLPAGSDPADAFLLRMQQRTARTLELADRLLEQPAIQHLVGQINVLGIILDTTARSILARAATLRQQRLRALDSEEDRAEATAAWREVSRRRVEAELQDWVAGQGDTAAQMTTNVLRNLLAWMLADIEEERGTRSLQTLPNETLEQTVLDYLTRQDLPQILGRLSQFYADDIADSMLGRLALEQCSPDELRQFLETGVLPPPALPGQMPAGQDGYLTVMNSHPYEAMREILFKRLFRQAEEHPWPTAPMTGNGTRGEAQLRPVAVDMQPEMPPEQVAAWAELMWKQTGELSDLDADALDALSAIWLHQARSPSDDAVASVDDLLALRGLKPKPGGSGRRGGYTQEQRADMLRALSHIQNIWLNMAEITVYEPATGQRRRPVVHAVQSRPFVITDRVGQLQLNGYLDVTSFVFRPGKVFALFLLGPGRQTALIAVKALQYHAVNQAIEKRLIRYLSYQWRVRANAANYDQPFRIATLLEAVGERPSRHHPSRTKDRLEKALETLLRDQIVAAWQYEHWDEDLVGRIGWIEQWLEATVHIEPPDHIREAYRSIERPAPAPRRALAPTDQSLGEQLRQHRQALRLSQLAVAEHLGIAPAYYGHLERGYRTPSPALLRRIRQWLARTQAALPPLE